MLDVILRTCDRVYSVHNDKQTRMPYAETTKLEIMLRCINSLIKSMNSVNFGLRLVVMDDHSKELDKISKLVNQCKHDTEVISLQETGNGASMYACYKWAKDNGRDRLFFVEDDYLHHEDCITEMLYEYDFFRMKLNHAVALSPSDNMDLYMHQAKNIVPCNIGIGRTRHWRSTRYSTFTFLCSKEILERYWYLFEVHRNYDDDPYLERDHTTNLIWEAPYKNAGGAFLLSPIPSLALHFHFKEHLSPFIDWKDWWDKNECDI